MVVVVVVVTTMVLACVGYLWRSPESPWSRCHPVRNFSVRPIPLLSRFDDDDSEPDSNDSMNNTDDPFAPTDVEPMASFRVDIEAVLDRLSRTELDDLILNLRNLGGSGGSLSGSSQELPTDHPCGSNLPLPDLHGKPVDIDQSGGLDEIRSIDTDTDSVSGDPWSSSEELEEIGI